MKIKIEITGETNKNTTKEIIDEVSKIFKNIQHIKLTQVNE